MAFARRLLNLTLSDHAAKREINRGKKMYGMYGKLTVQRGKRDQLIEIMSRAAKVVGTLTGCRLYVINLDPDDEMSIGIYEVWDDREAHDASLNDERVKSLIAEARPLLGGPPEGVELQVVGGHGIEG